MKVSLTKAVPLIFALALGGACAIYTYLDRQWPSVHGGLVHALELKLLDSKFRTRGRVDVEPGVVIAAGDEKTIAAWGRWGTWDRKRYAAVLKNLFEAGADVVAFDLVFADEAGLDFEQSTRVVDVLSRAQLSERAGALAMKLDARPGSVTPAELAQIAIEAQAIENMVKEATASDALLAHELDENTSRIVQGFIAQTTAESTNPPEAEREKTFQQIKDFAITEYGTGFRIREGQGGGAEATVVELKAVEGGKAGDLRSVLPVLGELVVPLDKFLKPASYLGFFTADPDPDGTMRRLPLVYRYGDAFLPSISLMAAALHFGSTPLLIADENFTEGLKEIAFAGEAAKVITVPVDESGALRINYYGPSEARAEGDTEAERGTFRRIPLVDLERGEFDKALVKGKIVVVAVTAIGTYDQRVTPFSPIVPGTEIHVAAIQNMISGSALDRPELHIQIEMALAMLLAVLMGLLLPRFNVAGSAGFVLAAMVAWVVVDQSLLFRANLWFYQVPLQLQLVLTWAGVTAWGYLTEGREKTRLKKEFSTVLAPAVVEALMKNPALAGLGGAERECTVMFSDIRGFTTMSEKLSPEGLTQFLNEYLTPMTEILIQRSGTLDKYMGDAIMAFWGAPITQADHAARACLAALDMMEELNKKLRPRWKTEGKPDIDIGIGLNSGLMRVGFMGSERMRNYTLLGDNVNLGSRLEGTNKNYGTNIIISGATLNAAKSAVYGRELDAVRVKGKLEPVKIYELLGAGQPSAHDKQWITLFEAALALYRHKRFDEAEQHFKMVIAMRGGKDPPSDVYLERLAHFREEAPPENWDGVYDFKTK